MRRPVDLCVKRLSLNSHKPSGHIPVSSLGGLWGMVGLWCCWSLSVEISSFFFLGGHHHFNFADYSSSALFVTCFLFQTLTHRSSLEVCCWLCFCSHAKCSWRSEPHARCPAPDPFILPQDFPWVADSSTSWVSQFGCPADTSNATVLPNSLSQWVWYLSLSIHPFNHLGQNMIAIILTFLLLERTTD